MLNAKQAMLKDAVYKIHVQSTYLSHLVQDSMGQQNTMAGIPASSMTADPLAPFHTARTQEGIGPASQRPHDHPITTLPFPQKGKKKRGW